MLNRQHFKDLIALCETIQRNNDVRALSMFDEEQVQLIQRLHDYLPEILEVSRLVFNGHVPLNPQPEGSCAGSQII